jgi:hypothetical protein
LASGFPGTGLWRVTKWDHQNSVEVVVEAGLEVEDVDGVVGAGAELLAFLRLLIVKLWMSRTYIVIKVVHIRKRTFLLDPILRSRVITPAL